MALSIDYGQRHSRELTFAKMQADALQIPHHIADLSTLAEILPGSSQTDLSVPVPHGHYEEESMKATVVPNRNMILLAVALGHAVAHRFDGVSYAAHAGDHAIYPDCRPEFVDALNKAAALCDWHKVEIFRPFIQMSKANIVSLGAGLKVPFEHTYSCYTGALVHCGRCGTCTERIEAFAKAEVEDPTTYDLPDAEIVPDPDKNIANY